MDTSLLMNLAIEGFAFGATVIAGLFGVLKAVSKNQSQTQKEIQQAFLDHLEKKNGHFERVTARIAESHKESNREFTKELSKLRTSLETNGRVLDKALEVIYKK